MNTSIQLKIMGYYSCRTQTYRLHKHEVPRAGIRSYFYTSSHNLSPLTGLPHVALILTVLLIISIFICSIDFCKQPIEGYIRVGSNKHKLTQYYERIQKKPHKLWSTNKKTYQEHPNTIIPGTWKLKMVYILGKITELSSKPNTSSLKDHNSKLHPAACLNSKLA